MKKLNREQRKLLTNKFSGDLSDWLIKSDRYESTDGSKRLSREGGKVRVLELINRSTDEIRKVVV